MRTLQEKWIPDFVALGPAVQHEGKTVRPETRVSIAIGKVSEMKESGKNNYKAEVLVSGAKFPFSGFLNGNSPVAKLLFEAQEKEAVVAVRFERKRKKDVDPTTPIMELTKDANTAKDNIVWVVAGVYNFNDNSWILTDDGQSSPTEDDPSVEAELGKLSYTTEGFFETPKVKVQTTDSDWQINHLVSMFTYASEHNFENKLDLEVKQIKFLAKYMLRACDQLQTKTLNLPAPNYTDYSHTKVRGMLFSWMRVNPLTKEVMSSKADFTAWITKFLEDSLEVWEWATTEVEK